TNLPRIAPRVPATYQENPMKRVTTFGALGIAALALVGCGGSKSGISGSGSSFVAPMMKKWASDYRKAKSIDVDYTSAGSGTGVTQMIEKRTDFGCTDAPMNAEQLDKARQAGGDVIHVPLVMGGVVPIYNLPDVDHVRFTGPILADIFLGMITKWNDPA